MAIYPLTIPLMASPTELVMLTIVSANRRVGWEEWILLAVMLLVIMAINGLGDLIRQLLSS